MRIADLTDEEYLRRLAPEIRTMTAACLNAVTRARASEAEGQRQREVAKRLMYQLRAQGLPARRLASIVGLSHSRVEQLTKGYRPRGGTKAG